MRKGKIRICEVCHRAINPGGMGGHLRLAHGISLKTVVEHVPDKSASASQKVVSKIQRPSDYVGKKSVVVEIRKSVSTNDVLDNARRTLLTSVGDEYVKIKSPEHTDILKFIDKIIFKKGVAYLINNASSLGLTIERIPMSK